MPCYQKMTSISKMIISSNEFETSAPHTFRDLWNDENFTDVTLVTVDEQQIRAHKVILSSCSPMFRNILVKNPHQNPLLYLKDIQHKELELLMRFIYLGQCEVGQGGLEGFLQAGRELKVKGLMGGVEGLNQLDTFLSKATDQKTSYVAAEINEIITNSILGDGITEDWSENEVVSNIPNAETKKKYKRSRHHSGKQ